MQIHYLEIVTDDVDALCKTQEAIHGVTFSAPQEGLGGARVADFADGGRIGIRGPMHESEACVVRPYLRVDDIQKAVSAAEKSGAATIHPPLEIPGQGTFAICQTGDIQHGYWQV